MLNAHHVFCVPTGANAPGSVARALFPSRTIPTIRTSHQTWAKVRVAQGASEILNVASNIEIDRSKLLVGAYSGRARAPVISILSELSLEKAQGLRLEGH